MFVSCAFCNASFDGDGGPSGLGVGRRIAFDAVGLGIAASVAAGGGFGMLVWNIHRLADWIYLRMVGGRKVSLVEPPICAHCGSVMQLRARHVQFARLVPDRHADMAVVVS